MIGPANKDCNELKTPIFIESKIRYGIKKLNAVLDLWISMTKVHPRIGVIILDEAHHVENIESKKGMNGNMIVATTTDNAAGLNIFLNFGLNKYFKIKDRMTTPMSVI